jgi:hypothetical protein
VVGHISNHGTAGAKLRRAASPLSMGDRSMGR